MKNINEKAAHLIEGSVWQNKHGKTYTVLLVSNVTVNAKLADRFIPSVTFINASGEVFTLDCDTFLRAYQWVEDNGLMMSCIEQVYKCNAGELETVDPDTFVDELEQEVGTDEPEEPTEQPEVEQPVEESPEPGLTLAEQLVKPFIVDFVTEGQPVLSKKELSQAFEGYSSYMDSRGVVFHKLMFSVRDNVIAYTLNQTFNPSVYKDEQNGYDSIHLNTGHVDFDITWNAFGYVGAEVINGCEYLTVVLANEPQELFNEQDTGEEPVVEQPVEAEVEQEIEQPAECQADDEADTEQSIEEPIEESAEQDDGSTVELVNVEPVEEPLQEQPTEEQPVEEPKIIAHLASPLDGIQVIHTEQPQVKQPVEEPIEINVDDVKVERPKTEEEQAMDNYFDVVDITDAQAEQVAQEVTKA